MCCLCLYRAHYHHPHHHLISNGTFQESPSLVVCGPNKESETGCWLNRGSSLSAHYWDNIPLSKSMLPSSRPLVDLTTLAAPDDNVSGNGLPSEVLPRTTLRTLFFICSHCDRGQCYCSVDSAHRRAIIFPIFVF